MGAVEPLLQLMSNVPNPEVVEALQHLLDLARQGKLPGFAYIAQHGRGDFSGDVLGTARANLFTSIGIVRSLQHKLERLL